MTTKDKMDMLTGYIIIFGAIFGCLYFGFKFITKPSIPSAYSICRETTTKTFQKMKRPEPDMQAAVFCQNNGNKALKS